MLLAFGAVFEMPIVVFLLTKLNILKPEFLKKNKGIIIVIIFIAAIITPSDVISQIILGVPIVMLLEIITKICELVYKTNKSKTEEEIQE